MKDKKIKELEERIKELEEELIHTGMFDRRGKILQRQIEELEVMKIRVEFEKETKEPCCDDMATLIERGSVFKTVEGDWCTDFVHSKQTEAILYYCPFCGCKYDVKWKPEAGLDDNARKIKPGSLGPKTDKPELNAFKKWADEEEEKE